MTFTDLFSEKSATYAQARPTYPDALFEFLAGVAPARERAWDCATGSGQAATGLARHFREVEATDASAQQIANAIPVRGVHYSVQPAEATRFAPGSFDAVCVAQALHWFDLDRFYAEARRVLRPRGVVAAWGYDRMEVNPQVDRAIERRILAVLKPYWPKQNALLWAGYRDIRFPFESIAMPRFSIEMRWTLGEVLAYIGTWSATRRCIAERGHGFLDAAAAALEKPWGESQLVVMPLHMMCGRVD